MIKNINQEGIQFMFQLDKTLSIPIYQQIVTSVISFVASGHLRYGDQLPTEWQCHELYDISSVIVKKAYKELTKLGYVLRKRGRGTTISYLPKLSIPLDQIIQLARVNSNLHESLLLKYYDSSNDTYNWKYLIKIGSLTIGYQEISIHEIKGYNFMDEYATLLRLINDQVMNENRIQSKKADALLASIFDVNMASPVFSITHRNENVIVLTFLRSDVFTLSASAYGN